MLLCLLSHLQGSEESTVTVHDNEPESVVVREERSESLRVELVITEVQRGVDRLERLKVNVHFLLFSLISDDGAAVDDLVKISIVKPESEVPKSKVPKSRSKGLGLTQ